MILVHANPHTSVALKVLTDSPCFESDGFIAYPKE